MPRRATPSNATLDLESKPSPSVAAIFLAFAAMSAIGFGGVLPWARRMLVEQRRWLTPDEFTETLSLAQFLPGGNIINTGIVVGQRFRGIAGSIAAVAGLLAAPTVIVILLAILYDRYGQSAIVQDALEGATAAAAGLILSTAAKMGAPLVLRRSVVPAGFALATFVMAALLHVPLVIVLIIIAPLSVAFAWWQLRGS